MALGEWLRSDGPNGTLVAPEGSRSKSAVFVRCCSLQTVTIGRAVLFALLPRPADVLARFSDRVGIVEVSRRLAQQEHVLVRPRRPIRHTLRHRVRLVPNYVGPQVPSVRLEGESHPPRDSDKVFDFEDVVFGQSAVICRSIVAPFALPLCGRSCESVAIPVAIAQVQPDCPVWPQHLANPAEYLNQLGDILLGRLLQADLTVHAVVSKPEVRRRCYHRLHRFRRQDVGHAFGLVAVNDGHYGSSSTIPTVAASGSGRRNSALPTIAAALNNACAALSKSSDVSSRAV